MAIDISFTPYRITRISYIRDMGIEEHSSLMGLITSPCPTGKGHRDTPGPEGLPPLLLIFCLSLLTLFGTSQFFKHSDIPTSAVQCANQVTLRGAFRIGRRTFETLIFVQRHPLGPRSTETLTTSSHFVKLVMYTCRQRTLLREPSTTRTARRE